jgi:general secretion pathway protein A
MYNKFFGFSEKPFEPTPDPKFLYLPRSHREALASMTHAINNRNGFISVTGEVGTGKTMLIHAFLTHLDERVRTVHIFHTTLTFNELLKTILSELHVADIKEDTAALVTQLAQYVRQINSKNEMLAIIIDEAQDLPPIVMKDLQTITPLGSKGMKIVFVGQPGFEDKLKAEDLEPLKQSIETRRQIRGFSEEESANYIDHRLKLVGRSSLEIFSPEALSLICSYSRGIPRVINILCDNALLMGFRSSTKKIEVDTIQEVIRNLEGPRRRKAVFSSTALVNKFHAFPFGLNFLLKKATLIIALSLLCLGAFIFLTHRYLQQKSDKPLEIKSLQSRKVDTKPPSTPISSQKTQPPPQKTPPPASAAALGRDYTLKKIVAVKKGQTISQLTQEYYGMVNLTLIDLLLELNPTITNVHLILVDQEIKIPNITEKLLVVPSADHTYKIHAGTFETLDPAKLYGDEPALKGKEVETLPRSVSPREAWHRVLIGKFNNKDEALKMIFLLKEKGLLPAFGGLLKNQSEDIKIGTHSFFSKNWSGRAIWRASAPEGAQLMEPHGQSPWYLYEIPAYACGR